MAAVDYTGKLFIGGLSWQTNKNRLHEYFSRFGQVTAVVIMRDHKTHLGRGFGFVIFSDVSVAEHVTMEKHIIDGRLVSAKKVVPKDENSIVSKSTAISKGITRKIFVGGLPKNVTEADFRRAFEQFGTITDLVLIYNHNTKRPRGFGFITYNSVDAMEKALLKSSHEMDGKMVEVKRVVPRERAPTGLVACSPMRVGQNKAVNCSLNDFNQGYSPIEGHGGLLLGAQNDFSSFGLGFGMGMNAEGGMNGTFGANSSFISSSNGRQMGSYYNRSSNRLVGPIGYLAGINNSGSVFSSMSWSVWGNGNLNYLTIPTHMNVFASPGNGGQVSITSGNWGGIPSVHGMGNISSLVSGNLGRGARYNNFGLPSESYGRSNSTGAIGEPFFASCNI
ncbi:unnamed protein product [Urochloa humidicola]